jgi:hypothetical protein
MNDAFYTQFLTVDLVIWIHNFNLRLGRFMMDAKIQ